MGQKLVQQAAIPGQKETSGNRVQHARCVNHPIGNAIQMAIVLLGVAVNGQHFLGRDLRVAAQVVEHVVHVNRLIHRPGGAGLHVGEIGIRQVDLRAFFLPAVPARQRRGR